MYLIRLLLVEDDDNYDLVCLNDKTLGLITLYIVLDLVYDINDNKGGRKFMISSKLLLE